MLTAALGWLGTTGTFMAYLLLWRGRLMSESLTYGLLNTVGGLLAGTASVLYGAWPSAASNYVWATIGLHGVLTAMRHRRRSTSRGLRRSEELMVKTPEDCLT